jgi:ribosomal protein S15P/S13E
VTQLHVKTRRCNDDTAAAAFPCRFSDDEAVFACFNFRMASDKSPHPADLNALATEALDLWQEHLATYTSDPKVKEELMRVMEPQRRLFADWAAMLQNGLHERGASTKQRPYGTPAAKAGTTAATVASDDGALRLSQLAHRVAQLEKHLAEFEKRLAWLGSRRVRPAAKTARPVKRVRR